jgi:hypothetical protein
MNFSVSVHAIADHLWWVKAIDDPQWNNQGNFVNWVTTANDCIAAFLDISNTYKHSERERPTQQNKVTDHLKLHPDDKVIKTPILLTNSNFETVLEIKSSQQIASTGR